MVLRLRQHAVRTVWLAPAPTCPERPPAPMPEHLRLGASYLENRGVTLEVFRAAGGEIVPDASQLDPTFPRGPAIVFRFHDPLTDQPLSFYDQNGEARPFVRLRRLAGGGKRFLQPSGSSTHVFYAPLRSGHWRDVFADTNRHIVISEGEARALAGAVRDIPVIGLTGVWCGQQKGKLHPDLEPIRWQGRSVFLTFDSDISRNDDVQRALDQLAGLLTARGAVAHQVRLPTTPEGLKQGLDDYLEKHGRDSFIALTRSAETTLLQPGGAELLGQAVSLQEELSVADLVKREVAPVPELIPGWIEKGLPNFLAGPGGVHKSRLALQWGLCIASGLPVWGMEVEPAALVYVSAEDDANELARRAQAIVKHLHPGTLRPTVNRSRREESIILARKGMDSALVVMGENGGVEVRPFYRELTERLRAMPGHKLLVLDSAYDFARFTGRAKIDEDSVNFFIKVVLQGICDACDCTMIIPWHPSQAGSERDTMDGWSVAWQNAPRARLALKAVKDTPDTYELSVAKRNHGAKRPPVQLRFHDGALLPVELLPDDGKHGAFLRVLATEAIAVANLKTPLNRVKRPPEMVVNACATAFGRRPSRQEIRDGLDQCVRDGRLQFLDRTRHRAAGYYPPDAATAVALSHAAKRAEVRTGDA